MEDNVEDIPKIQKDDIAPSGNINAHDKGNDVEVKELEKREV